MSLYLISAKTKVKSRIKSPKHNLIILTTTILIKTDPELIAAKNIIAHASVILTKSFSCLEAL
jgi:hypothetical protein